MDEIEKMAQAFAAQQPGAQQASKKDDDSPIEADVKEKKK